MDTRIDQETIKKAITDSVDFWLSQHPISFPSTVQAAINESFYSWLDRFPVDAMGDLFEEAIKEAAKEAFSRWLEEHSEQLIEALIQKQGGEHGWKN